MRNYRYNLGDVLVLHPFAAASEVDSSVIMIRCANAADDLFTVKHTMLGRFGKPCSQYHRLIFGTRQIFLDMYQATSPIASIERAVRDPPPIVLFFFQ